RALDIGWPVPAPEGAGEGVNGSNTTGLTEDVPLDPGDFGLQRPYVMSGTPTARNEPGKLFTRRNFALLLAGLVCVVAGYVTLASGAASLAAVLLVIGYVVIFPLALLA